MDISRYPAGNRYHFMAVEHDTAMTEVTKFEPRTLREKLGVESPAALPWINMLIYGDPGVGKTRLAGSSILNPDMSPVLIIDIDGGAATLKSMGWDEIDVVQVRSMKHMQSIIAELEKRPEYYKTIGIDSLGELQKLDMNFIMKEAYSRNPNSVDKDVPSPREWGKTLMHMRDVVRSVRDLPCNTVLTCHAKVEVNNETARMTYWPSMPGKMAAELAGFVDIVGYFYVNSVKVRNEKTNRSEYRNVRTIMFEDDGFHKAKTRFNQIPSVVENPTMPMLWEMLNKNEGT
ncbi:MAG TPA: ATP-binding protein [Candidatus Saccharimonadales bacterium]|nr:ATP-binding protein [Candidatus Saccharimonadales bacterium]